jgi:glycerophosphoryl diester phosphodiesterase
MHGRRIEIKISMLKRVQRFLIFWFFFHAHSIKCQSPDFDIQGHRGARGLFPENTIAGFIEAVKMGVNTLEMDVVITKDHQVVLSHEPWLSDEICLGVSNDKKKHNIYAMNYEEVQQFDCGSKPHPKFPHQKNFPCRKPLLSEVFDSVEAFVKASNLPLPYYNIETKSTPDGDNKFHPEPQKFMELVYDIIKSQELIYRCVIQSFDVRTLKALKEINCFMPQALLVANAHGVKKNVQQLGFTPAIYSPNYLLVNKKTVKQCHKLGMKIIPWTVNDVSKMKKIKRLGCDGVITDYPNLAVEKLR